MTAVVDWVWRHATEWGADPTTIALAGHSAGAHLAAMLLSCRVEGRGRRPAGAAVDWGAGDFRALRPGAAAAHPFFAGRPEVDPGFGGPASPAFFPRPKSASFYTTVGMDESEEFVRQNGLIRDVWGPTAVPVCEMVPRANHFTASTAGGSGRPAARPGAAPAGPALGFCGTGRGPPIPCAADTPAQTQVGPETVAGHACEMRTHKVRLAAGCKMPDIETLAHRRRPVALAGMGAGHTRPGAMDRAGAGIGHHQLRPRRHLRWLQRGGSLWPGAGCSTGSAPADAARHQVRHQACQPPAAGAPHQVPTTVHARMCWPAWTIRCRRCTPTTSTCCCCTGPTC